MNSQEIIKHKALRHIHDRKRDRELRLLRASVSLMTTLVRDPIKLSTWAALRAIVEKNCPTIEFPKAVKLSDAQ